MFEESVPIQAGGIVKFPIAEKARYFYPYVVSGSVEVSFGGAGYYPVRQSVGRIFATPPEEVYFRNTGGGAAEITFEISEGQVDDRRFNLSGTVAVRGGGDAMTNPVETVVSNAAVEILPANAKRTSAVIYAGAADLFIGKDNAITAGDVVDIEAGGSAVITHTGSVWAIRAAAGTVKCRVREEETA